MTRAGPAAVRALAWGFAWASWTVGWPVLARVATARGWHVSAAGLPLSDWHPDMTMVDVWFLRGLSLPAWFGWTALWLVLGLGASVLAALLAGADREGLARRSLAWSFRSGRCWVAMGATSAAGLAVILLFRGTSAFWGFVTITWILVPVVFDWWALRAAVVGPDAMGAWSTMPPPRRRTFAGWLIVKAVSWAVDHVPLIGVVLAWPVRIFEVHWLLRRDEPDALRPVLSQMSRLRLLGPWLALGLKVLFWASLIAGPVLAIGSFSLFDVPALVGLAQHHQQELPWLYKESAPALRALRERWVLVATFLLLPLTCAYALAEGRLSFLQRQAQPGPSA